MVLKGPGSGPGFPRLYSWWTRYTPEVEAAVRRFQKLVLLWPLAMSEEAEVWRTAGLRMTDEEKMMKQTEEKRRRLWQEGIKVRCRLCIQLQSCQNPQCSNTGEEAVWT